MTVSQIAIGLAAVMTSAVLSVGLWRETERQAAQVRQAAERIQVLQKELRSLSALPGARVPPIAATYTSVMDVLAMLPRRYDLKFYAAVDGAQEGVDLRSMLQTSRWPGIGQLALKVTFPDAEAMDNVMRILDVFQSLEVQYPLQIAGVQHTGKSLEVVLHVYGVAD